MSGYQSSLWVLFWLLALLSGCADPDPGIVVDPNAPRLEDIPLAQKVAFASSYPLYDARSREETSPRSPDGKAPFGVLLDFLNRKQLALCTVTHFAPGKVLTNAHCVARDKRLAAYFLVFYDREGRHAYAPVKRFAFVGSPLGQDFALLEIDPTDADRWDTVDTTITSTAAFRDRALGSSNFATTVWAFDPIQRHPDIGYPGRGRRGAVFLPRQCTGFRTRPRIDMITTSLESLPYPWTPAESSIHLFLDQCSHALVGGNSGALISRGDDTRQAVGVFHWIVTLKDPRLLRRIARYEYIGSRGTQEIIPGGVGVSLYQVGTDLETARERNPGTL